MRILNRMIHWTDSGIEYEVDHRHAEIMLAELGLGMGSKNVTTPGVQMKREESVA